MEDDQEYTQACLYDQILKRILLESVEESIVWLSLACHKVYSAL